MGPAHRRADEINGKDEQQHTRYCHDAGLVEQPNHTSDGVGPTVASLLLRGRREAWSANRRNARQTQATPSFLNYAFAPSVYRGVAGNTPIRPCTSAGTP